MRVYVTLIGLSLALAVSLPCLATTPGDQDAAHRVLEKGGTEKAAWQWTIDERLAARLLPENMLARSQKSLEPSGQGHGQAIVDVVDGSRNPELLLPWEVFESLLSNAFSENAEYRESYRQSVAPADPEMSKHLWAALEQAAGAFLQRRSTERELGSELGRAAPQERDAILRRIEKVQSNQCALRAEGLRRVRAHFAEGIFDRYLYEKVAHLVRQMGEVGDSLAEYEETLRRVEGGCQ